MLIARICFVYNNKLIRLQSSFLNVRSHKSDSSNSLECVMKAFSMSNCTLSLLSAIPSVLSV